MVGTTLIVQININTNNENFDNLLMFITRLTNSDRDYVLTSETNTEVFLAAA